MPQGPSTTAFAKSTRPEIGGVVAREALFARLDGTPVRTVAWISAPPGFGKTTLAASYVEARNYRWAWYQVDPDDDDGETFLHYLALAMRKLRGDDPDLPVFGPEHHADIAAFARRFFRALFAGAAGPIALVLDNLHELGPDSPLRTVLEAGLPQVPRQCCVVVTSRTPPPPAFAAMQPGGQMVSLLADELRMAPAELAEMARLRGQSLDEETLLGMHRRADGWAAALVLMIEHRKLGGARAEPAGDSTPEVVFDYFAGAVFERFEPATQRLLLQIACVPRVTIEIARELTGNDSAGRVLFNLAYNDYFVREVVGPDGRLFLPHPLMRQFLLRRAARDLPQAVDTAALRRAARLLRDSGQPEDAVALLAETRDWAEIAAIVGTHAERLLAEGRHAMLASWLDLLPPSVVEADAELLLRQGAALMPVSPRAARRRFEEAHGAAQRAGDPGRAARASLGVIEAVLGEFDDLAELDRWIAEYDRSAGTVDAGGSAVAALWVARLWRDPARLDAAARSARGRAEESSRVSLARSVAAVLGGDFTRADSLAEDARVGGASPPGIRAVEALRHLIDGDFDTALEAARAGLRLGAASAIHGLDAWLRMLCVAAALGRKGFDVARAELEIVRGMPLRRGDRAFVLYLSGWLARAAGERGVELREAKGAVLLAVESGLPWLEWLARIEAAHLLAAAGDRRGAEAQVRGAEALAERLGSPLARLSTLLLQAAVAVASGEEEAAVAPLQSGLALARELGVRHVVGLPRELLSDVCAVALRRGIAVDHTRALIVAGKVAPPPSALRLRRWPWAFEVETLGGFGLRRGGEPVEFSAKGPGRPVELLKVLLSLGGQNVRAEQLADALWPHVDADYAHKSFTATLHRLRRIFGEDETLRLSDGRLSLNATMFRVDTWALDHLLAEIDARLRDGDVRAADQALNGLMEETLELYAGPFLPDEAEQPAYIAHREQVRARLLRALTRIARRWEEGGRGAEAVDCYLRCIDADPLCEAFYRNLMLCYQRHGDLAEAAATFRRLETVLAARLRSVPSPETHAIHASLRG